MTRFIPVQRAWRQVLALLAMIVLLSACGGGGGDNGLPVAPAITAQPADVSVVAGRAATFSVTATGHMPRYQWQVSNDKGASWADIPGATASSYHLAATTPADSGRLWRVLVTAGGATVASSPSHLTVTPAAQAPAIAAQPANQNVTEPATATFSVTATGTEPRYQWQESRDGGGTWADIDGAISASYTTPATGVANNGTRLRVRVSNTAGSVTSAAATLGVSAAPTGNAAPAITTQPGSQSVAAGGSVTFSAAVSGTPAPTLQWQRSNNGGASWADIAGATGNAYTLTNAAASDNGARLRLVATNSAGSVTSAVATLTVTAAPAAPVLTTQPQNATVAVGASAHFSVAASGVPTPTFQWQSSVNQGQTWTSIAGATAASYDTPATAAGDNGKRFRAVASNSQGTANSAAATLTVTVPTPEPGSLSIDGVARAVANTLYRYQAVVVNATASAFQWLWGDGKPDGAGNPVAKVWQRTVGASNFQTSVKAATNFGELTATHTTGVIGQPIALGWDHSCAIQASGVLACWGDDDSGRLGNGAATGIVATPQALSSLGAVVAVSVDRLHSCAVKADGTVWCWGYNFDGELGDGSFVNKNAPVQVGGLSNAVAISTGQSHSCALRADGSVACWGENGTGELGDGGIVVQSNTPLDVAGLSRIVALSSADRHTCALNADGLVFCWGTANASGELGHSDAAKTKVPTQVAGLSGVAALKAGFEHTCALKFDGTVHCWGRNDQGQLGRGTQDGVGTPLPAPVPVSNLSGVMALAAGGSHTCALKSDRSLVCWGDNGFGQLGAGSSAFSSLTPVTAIQANGSPLTDVAAVEAGHNNHTCALKTDGRLFCAGLNSRSQLGDGSSTNRLVFTEVAGGAAFWK
jgi:alpha-tubulin suppressor-like RCC1 family protein